METPKNMAKRKTTKTRASNKDVADMLNNRGGNLINNVSKTLERDEDHFMESDIPSTSRDNPNSVSDPDTIPLDVLETGEHLLKVLTPSSDDEMDCEEILNVTVVEGEPQYSVPLDRTWTSVQVIEFAEQFLKAIKCIQSDVRPSTSSRAGGKKDSPEAKRVRESAPVEPPSSNIIDEMVKKLSDGIRLRPLCIGYVHLIVSLKALEVTECEARRIASESNCTDIVDLIKRLRRYKGLSGKMFDNYAE